MQTLLQVLLPLLLVGCPASQGAEDEDAASVTGQAAHLRHAVVPVEPGTPVVYMVSLVGVPHEQTDSSLESNKVNPELAPQSPLTNLLLLTSRNKFHDNPGLAMRDVTRKKRSPTVKRKYYGGGGGGCGYGNCGGGQPIVVAVPYGGGGGCNTCGGGGYPYSGGGGYPYSGGGGYPHSGGGGYPYVGGGGKGGGGYSQSYSQSSAQSSSYGWGRK